MIFNGDNYTEKWHAEAERRGLPNRRTAVESFPDIISPKSIKLFTKYAVFNERELHSRYEIFVEGYHKTINIESQLTLQMADADDPAGCPAVPGGSRPVDRQPEGHRRDRAQGSDGPFERARRGDRSASDRHRQAQRERSTITWKAIRSRTPSTPAT